MKLAKLLLNQIEEKLSKQKISSFVKFVKEQINLDLTPYLDIKNSKRDYVTVDTHAIGDMDLRRLMQLEHSYKGKYFSTSDNGGLGRAFHLKGDLINESKAADAIRFELAKMKPDDKTLNLLKKMLLGEEPLKPAEATKVRKDILDKLRHNLKYSLDGWGLNDVKLALGMKLTESDEVKSLKRVISNSKSAIAMMKLQANNQELSDERREEAKESLKAWQEKLKNQQERLKELLKKV
jgi:hypothetical protein